MESITEQSTQEEVKDSKKDNNTLWYAARISFYTMVFLWVFSLSIAEDPINTTTILISLLLCIFVFSSFITSIIHLTIFKEKGLAVTSLVISSIGIIAILSGL